MRRRWQIVILAMLVSTAALSACRVDIAVHVTMIENGSGTVTVTVTADAAIVEKAPGLVDDLRFDDVLQAGWTFEGPTDTETGGLSVVLAHRFDTPQQATALLATLNGAGGPFKAIAIDRSATKSAITYTVTGSAGIDDLGAFADEALVGLAGGQPYADEIGPRPPADSVRITLIIDFPGSVAETTSTSREMPLEWQVPVADSDIELTSISSKSLDRGRNWELLATASFVALGMTVLLGLVFVLIVGRRQSTRRRRKRSLRALIDLHDAESATDDH